MMDFIRKENLKMYESLEKLHNSTPVDKRKIPNDYTFDLLPQFPIKSRVEFDELNTELNQEEVENQLVRKLFIRFL